MLRTHLIQHLHNPNGPEPISSVLDDNFKGSTEQFVLHFNEQLRQLDEISEDSE